jgi:thiosulfate/3-mercaptopyruvate sulfurtransferase
MICTDIKTLKKGYLMSLITFPSDLVSVAWLAENIDKSSLILLDASYFMANLARDGEAEWLKETIPGARYFDFDKTICDQNSNLPHMMPSVELFEQASQALGINRNSALVVFDRLGIFSSPRVWWMFKSMGFNNIAVLDGGLNSWKEAGFPLSPGKEYSVTNNTIDKGDFIASFQATFIADKQDVLIAIENNKIQIVDARAENRFLGEATEPPADLRSGHIPTAKNLPFNKLIENGKMRPIEQLRPLYEALFSQFDNKQRNIIFSCGSGVTACVLALGATLCGYKSLTVYDGSWTEWGADKRLPIVSGREK